MIAFIGSVFSPYYAWSGRGDPLDHCAINVALYRPRAGRWAMTERGRGKVNQSADHFAVGASCLSFDGRRLTIDIDDRCAPIPHKIRGRITAEIPHFTGQAFSLDDAARHRWRPLNPSVDVAIDFDAPNLSWTGHGYLDSNDGDEPLETGFRAWDWSRLALPNGEAAILYNTQPREGAPVNLALHFAADGSCQPFESPPRAALKPTPIWRIPRETRAGAGADPQIVRTFEDTPFYSRSMIRSQMMGHACTGFHESLAGDRLATRWVKCLLPFRMPRL